MGTILAIDPGNIKSGYVVVEHDGYRTNRTGYVVEVGGKRVCVRVDECREI